MTTSSEPIPKDKRSWYEYWPLLVVVIETVLNTDWVITPILMKRGIFFSTPLFSIRWDLAWLIPKLSNFWVFLWVSIISVPTSLGWYWLWGWLAKIIIKTAKEKESVKEAISLWKKTFLVLKRGGLINLAKEWAANTFNWATDQNNRWLKYLKRGGYTALFVISALPVSGGRIVATIFCRSADPVKGLSLLILGETIKNAIMVFGFWNLVFRVPVIYTQVTVATLILVVGILFIKKIFKKT